MTLTGADGSKAMHRQVGTPSFADALLPAKVGRNAQLEQVDAVLDWEPVAAVVRDLYAAPEGRPSYPPLVMVKVLVLQQWYNASDPEIEAALWDRLSFRHFVGLGLQDPVPDHSTISRFRSALAARGLGERVFAEVTRQLDAAGWLVKAGTLLDATLVAAQARRPSMDEGPGAGSATDPEARWTRKGGRAHFGYKAHLGVDAESGLIRRAILTPAHVNESEVADTLISGDERAVYADKAYESKVRRSRLRAQGIKDRIMHRSHKNQRGLPYWQQRRNALIAPRRAPVEQVFGTLKRSYGYRTVRYLGLARNLVELWFKCLAYNLRRAARLQELAGA